MTFDDPTLDADSDPVRQYVRWRDAHPGRGVPPRLVTDSGFALGVWVRRVRAARMAGTLPASRVRELDDIGFSWSGEEDRSRGRRWRSGSRWRELLGELDAYRDEHGDSIVPSSYTAPSGNRLGDWLARQQHAWRAGTLPQERQRDLYRRGVRPTREESLRAALDASPVLAVHAPSRRYLA
ncbi:helicase associated domain-containing protein [Dietzia sp. 179-F 9C3 NHS]|uniref:helicase associated domain-containing protein n=1 Tax=Dietzia sp. 179-F 9C3 NHS TaxID=3374295 RepID=UPI0038797317